MNKGLEVIEAKWMFDMPLESTNVVIHPQSIIHSMVEYSDGSVLAQMGAPDMRQPIQYALCYPKRIHNNFRRLDLLNTPHLTFERPDINKFPCLRLCYDAAKIGGTMPAVMNAANEVAVDKFLAEEISFIKIPELIERTMLAYTVKYGMTIEDILEADKWARAMTNKYQRSI
jgi:1-deoxy-D-xylulose-5-phosphate reductoisomerase